MAHSLIRRLEMLHLDGFPNEPVRTSIAGKSRQGDTIVLVITSNTVITKTSVDLEHCSLVTKYVTGCALIAGSVFRPGLITKNTAPADILGILQPTGIVFASKIQAPSTP
jgi:hypothetical protein